MLFKVERTSKWDDVKPCAEARKDVIECWDERTFKSPEEHDARFPNQPWHNSGSDHQIIYGSRGGAMGIKRRVEDRIAWYVEIKSLEELVGFRKKHGDIILRSANEDKVTPTIEIYDEYRE